MTPRFSVSDFLASLNQTLEYAYVAVEIVGEVAEFTVSQNKWVFFCLKDGESRVDCFMTVYQLRTAIENGMKVMVRAAPKVTKRGKFSLTVQDIKPVGEGDLRRSFELLRAKLDKEGLFDEARKRPLPRFPSNIAVISSTQAAGYADFMKIAEERWGGVVFRVAHVQVQGDAAADQIVRAIEYVGQLAELPEVVVIIRGGGSADDLSVFNDEVLVRAVAGSRVPVLTGIGHEVDESLVDLAADVRAATPSNAAQLLFPDKHDVLNRVSAEVRNVSGVVARAIHEQVATMHTGQLVILEQWRRNVDEVLRVVKSQQQLAAEYNPEVVLQRGYAIISGEYKINGIVNITTLEEHMKARVIEYEKR